MVILHSIYETRLKYNVHLQCASQLQQKIVITLLQPYFCFYFYSLWWPKLLSTTMWWMLVNSSLCAAQEASLNKSVILAIIHYFRICSLMIMDDICLGLNCLALTSNRIAFSVLDLDRDCYLGCIGLLQISCYCTFLRTGARQ